MKILLINNNPVVSRLTALSARKEEIEIDEIQEVTELNSDTYDIVFVDADSWTKDVRDVIAENIKTQKSVLFYADGDEEEKASFDLSILKPFLPSEVSAVIRSIEENNEELANTSSEENHFNILDDVKVENRNELFDLGDIEEKKEDLTLSLDEEVSLEVKDVSFDDKLEEAFPTHDNKLDDDVLVDESKIELNIEDEVSEVGIEKSEDNNNLFDLDFSDEVPSLEDDLFAEEKKEETLDVMDDFELEDDVLEVALDADEPLHEEVKKETQVLDELEIQNIKGILTEDVSDEMTLEELMPTVDNTPTIEEEVSDLEANNVSEFDSKVLVETLSTMPIESLRELLAGAKVNIKIKFPKSRA